MWCSWVERILHCYRLTIPLPILGQLVSATMENNDQVPGAHFTWWIESFSYAGYALSSENYARVMKYHNYENMRGRFVTFCILIHFRTASMLTFPTAITSITQLCAIHHIFSPTRCGSM